MGLILLALEMTPIQWWGRGALDGGQVWKPSTRGGAPINARCDCDSGKLRAASLTSVQVACHSPADASDLATEHTMAPTTGNATSGPIDARRPRLDRQDGEPLMSAIARRWRAPSVFFLMKRDRPALTSWDTP
jgi:hypothetical protein